MAELYPPTSALVAIAWVSTRVPGFTASMVATRLPRKVADWAEDGFAQVTPITGTPDIDIPVRRPLVQVDLWAVKLDAEGNVTTTPPIAKANILAERVRIATEDDALYNTIVETPAAYENAIVYSVYPLSEPTEIPDDVSGYARVSFDLAFNWARA